MIRRSVIMAFGKTPTASTQFYRSLTVDHLQVPSTQTNFPVLVSVTDATLKTVGNGGHVQNSSGFDITFYSDSGKTTILKWEMEFYDPVNGIVVAWVKIASLASGSDTVFYMFYGDASITTDQSDKNNVWDTDFQAVWHLGDGTTLSLADSTSHARTLTNTGSVGATSGQIDGAAGSFNGTSQALGTSATVDLTGTMAVTLSMWADWTTYANNDDLLSESSTNFNSAAGAFLIDPNAASGFFSVSYHHSSFNGGHFTRPASGMKHFVFTIDNTAGTSALVAAAYVNGVSQTMTQDTNTIHLGANRFFGNFSIYLMSRAATSLFGAGKLDEVRLSQIVRSSDWITSEFNNQKPSSTFVAVGSETSF